MTVGWLGLFRLVWNGMCQGSHLYPNWMNLGGRAKNISSKRNFTLFHYFIYVCLEKVCLEIFLVKGVLGRDFDI